MSEADIPDSLPGWVADHVRLYLTDPEQAHWWDMSRAGTGLSGTIPTLLLVTRGRKSGRTIMLPLIYRKVGGNYVVIASRGGSPQHPAWYLNLIDAGEAEIRVGADILRVRPRVAEGDEREDLWNRMVEVYPPYTDYQAATSRRIPVVVLEPV
ncbi:MAG: nitroreductase/quinone reductase family protein [Pseudomonadota bacterium]